MFTADEAKEAIQEALIMFGEYTYFDKGPQEVMDVSDFVDKAKRSFDDYWDEMMESKDMEDIFVVFSPGEAPNTPPVAVIGKAISIYDLVDKIKESQK